MISLCRGRASLGSKPHILHLLAGSSLPRALLLACLTFAASLPAFAQSSVDGAIRGLVTAPNGTPVEAAVIVLLNTSTQLQTTFRTDPTGEFLAPALQPAEYTVTISATGFQQLVLQHAAVEVGGTIRLNAQLPPAHPSSESQVTVEADAAESLEDLSLGALPELISAPEIATLPADGRRWQTFALLTPQANPDVEDSSLLSFRGASVTQNSTRIDGVSDDQSFSGTHRGAGPDTGPETEDETESQAGAATRGFSAGAGPGRHPGADYTVSQAAVREFRVTGQNYSALYGHAAGGVIATVSRSGTDQLHGSIFYFLRSSALGAANPFAAVTSYANGTSQTSPVKPRDLRQQFGASLGGPLLSKRVFFFYTLDQQRRSFPAISSPEFPGFYSLTPMQRALLGNRGVTAARVDAALRYLDSLSGSVPRRSDQTVNFLKLDWQPTSSHRFSLSGNRARSSAPAGVRSSPVVNRAISSLGDSFARVDYLLGRWTWFRSERFSHEFRVQYGRDLHFERPQAPLPQEPAISPGGYAPEVVIGPQGFIFGTPASLGRRAFPDERRFQLAEVLTWARGRHLLQIGGDFSHLTDFVDSLANSEGTFQYDSGTTNGRAGGLVDWITDYTFNVNTVPNGGCPSVNASVHYFCFRNFSQSFGQQSVQFSTQEWSGFVQDTWRVRRGLDIGLGLRYDYEFLPLPQRPNPDLDLIFGRQGATSIIPEDRNNIGPRLNVAWEPFGAGRGEIRGGYGLYFGRLPGATVRSALLNTALPSSVTRIRVTPSTITPCPQVPNQGFGYPCAYLSAPPAAVAVSTSATVFGRHFRVPLSQQASFALSRELGRGTSATISYLLNLDRQLPNSVDINIAPSTSARTFRLQGGTGQPGLRDGQVFTLPFYSDRISSIYGPVTAILSNANASYNALVMEARHRSRAGLQFRISWTWSKSIDFGQNPGSVPQTNGQFDPFSIRFDKALSSLNYPHKIIGSAIWQPHPKLRSRALRALSEQWRFAGIFAENSGRPYSYNIFGGTRLSGGRESINGSGGAAYLPTIGRNVLRLPDTARVDLRLSRELDLRENLRLHASAEVFNLINRVNYTGVTERAFLVGDEANGVTPLIFQDAAAIATEGLNVRPFGAFTASNGDSRERRIQFNLRLEF